MGLGLRVSLWAQAYLVKAKAQPKPKVYSPSTVRVQYILAQPSPTYQIRTKRLGSISL
jgi:hypothetical protein